MVDRFETGSPAPLLAQRIGLSLLALRFNVWGGWTRSYYSRLR